MKLLLYLFCTSVLFKSRRMASVTLIKTKRTHQQVPFSWLLQIYNNNFPICYFLTIAWKYQNIFTLHSPTLSPFPIHIPSALSLPSILPLRRGRGILMLSQTMDNLGDFLCASVIWFYPEAVLFQSLLSGWPGPWKSDFPLSLLPFSCGLCEWDEFAAIVAWFSDLSIGSNDQGFDVQC